MSVPGALVRGYLGKLLRVFPPDNRLAAAACSRYLDRVNGDNNFDPRTNGENRYLDQILPGARTVFDIGANVGDWADYALRVNGGLALHCFEPCAAPYRRLAARPWPPTVHLNRAGCGAEAGEVELRVFARDSTLTSAFDRPGLDGMEEAGREVVTLDTVDRYCARHGITEVDLVKIDVEGFELEVLRGMPTMFAGKGVKHIQFEYGGCHLDARVQLWDIWTLLREHGFRMYKLFPQGPRLAAEYSRSFETFKYSNWVAVAPGVS